MKITESQLRKIIREELSKTGSVVLPPGWVELPNDGGYDNDKLGALIYFDEFNTYGPGRILPNGEKQAGTWMLSMDDGANNWIVRSPEEGFKEALMP
jgi:hypothetical protein